MNDLISRQAAIDSLRAMQTYKLFAGDDQLLIDQAGAQTELMMLPSAQPDLDEWCTDCSEYDQERHCCPRWNRVIRQTLKDAQPERKTGEWIPCSERLPEGNTIVLATTADYMYIVEFEVYSNGHMYWNEVNEYRSIEGVIAWMPLPPSFKEE